MADQDNVQRHREALEAFNRRDLDAVAGAYSDDILATDHAQQQTLKSPQGVRAWNEAWLEAFSDGRVEDVECIGSGDWTVARFVGRGTNDGPFATFEPTQQRVELHLCSVARWRDGMVVEEHTYYDAYGLLAQLGHVPPMAAA